MCTFNDCKKLLLICSLFSQNLFVISVGNLPSAAEAVIKVSYVTQLTVEDGGVCFNLPGCVAPWKEEDTLGVQTQVTSSSLVLSYELRWLHGLAAL